MTILFPNKRAGLFLAEELSRLITRPVWMPEIMTLGEFIGQFTGLRQAETLPLSIKLYKAYASISGSKERFDDFYFWGNMLLGDFDDIDKYLVDARDLFSNLSALKDLENNFPYLNEEQIAAIKKFWSSFHTGTCSREQQEFLQIWDKLYDTYTLFRSSLFEQQLCYEGMNERFFCEHVHEYELHSKRILFAGFNALNRCEKAIFSHYQGLGIASFYWDYDLYYTANEHQEAGDYLRENLKLFPNELGIEHFNNFLHNGKSIKYISVPSNIGQTKLIPDLITQADGATPKTAIVLCDEQLLIPTLHSIPPYIEKINVTMGYPAQKTAVASFIYLLCELKSHAKCEKNQTYYYYKPVVALLNHNFIKALCPSEINQITAYIQTQNIVYVIDKSLYFHPLAQAVFAPSQESLPDYLLRILHLLIQQKPVSEPIEKEFIFSIYSQLQNLQNTFKEEGIQPEEKLYVQIINKAINNITIPFSGEPLEGLQVMGLMETRMLDFKRLVILSANEGTLPKTTLPSSFIPYNLRVGFRLPTPEHQDALFAYYFYRLLQRAEDICILYTSGSKGINSGEMSRYLYQIKYESGLPIRESNFQNLISTSSPKPITIPKTQKIMDILARYEVSGQTALSPSALNTYIECPLRFYFKYVAGIKEPEEIAEELDARLLGTIFHECSQSLYATADGKEITAETIEPLITPKTKGIIAVHLMGWPCDMDPIMDLAKRRGLWVVEDCAQAHGAVYKGRPVGSIGDVGAWSFCQDKIITTGGEGGAVTTNNRDVYLKMWSYKDHGRDYDLVFNKKHPEGFRWYLESFGTNMRMTEMQAVLGIRGFKNLPEWHARRTANAKILSEAISKIPCARVPVRPGSIEHANYKFFFFTRPEALKSGWSAARVISEICARKIPAFSGTCWNISQENCFKKAGLSKSESELPVAALLRDTSVMTLIHPTLGDSEMEFAAEQICGVL